MYEILINCWIAERFNFLITDIEEMYVIQVVKLVFGQPKDMHELVAVKSIVKSAFELTFFLPTFMSKIRRGMLDKI